MPVPRGGIIGCEDIEKWEQRGAANVEAPGLDSFVGNFFF